MSSGGKYLWVPGRPLPPLEPHSEAKHHLFRAYLNAYINRLTRNPVQEKLRLTIVDGFCGGGAYQTHDTETSGSPMILLDEVAAAEQAVQMERNKTFGIDADFIFVDASRDHCAALRNRIVTSPYSYNLDKKITIRCDTFADAYEEIEASILARKGKRRALFFLDQYGYSDVPLSLIRRILSKIEGAEIILTFAIDSLINYLHDSEQFE